MPDCRCRIFRLSVVSLQVGGGWRENSHCFTAMAMTGQRDTLPTCRCHSYAAIRPAVVMVRPWVSESGPQCHSWSAATASFGALASTKQPRWRQRFVLFGDTTGNQTLGSIRCGRVCRTTTIEGLVLWALVLDRRPSYPQSWEASADLGKTQTAVFALSLAGRAGTYQTIGAEASRANCWTGENFPHPPRRGASYPRSCLGDSLNWHQDSLPWRRPCISSAV